MKKIKFYLGTGFAGASHEEIFEYPDEATDEEISGEFEAWKENYLDASWWEVDDE